MVEIEYFTQLVASGLLLGGLYALIAVGLTLVYGVLHIINLAHGSFVILGAFVGFWGWEVFGINPYLMIIPTMILLFIVALPLKRGLFDPIQGTELLNQLLLTFGIAIALEALMTIAWSANYRFIGWDPIVGAATVPGVGISLPYNRLGAFIFSLVLFGALYLLLYQTKIGRAIRATAESKDTASIVGVDVERTELMVFGLGTALAGASGVLLVTIVPLNPYSGINYVLLAFVIVTLGGMGSVFGSLVGGFLIGLVQTVTTIWISTTQAEALVFLLLIGIFIVRPAGLFGTPSEELSYG